MGSNRRMFSRRSVVGLLIGIVIGFNFASWIALPVPSRTNIEIEVIADRGKAKNGLNYPEFRVGVARVRRNNKLGVVKSGKDCDHEVVEYGNEVNNNNDKLVKLNSDYDKEEGIEQKKEDFNAFDEFDLEEERMKRQKELEVVYETDVESENEDELDEDPDMLEDFQYPANAKKYVDYETEMTPQTSKRKIGVKNRSQNELSYRPVVDNPESKVKKPHDRKHFIYVGVLTAQKYLETRGRAIVDSWAKLVPGKVEFYVGEGVETTNGRQPPLPLVKLKNVKDDAYPPQKKSFMLLKNMYDEYLNSGYQWFMRADDDAYVKTEHLEKFLRTLNSSQPIFLGQTGLGNAEERGRLSLPHGDNYCMGGPGMIFSREVLRRVGPHIRYCIRNLYSWHEDVELSRCIRRFADVNCAWSYQMQELFYEHYTLRKGYIDPYEDPNNLKLYSAFTLHPNKNPQYQIKLHKFMKSLRLQELYTKIKEHSRDVLSMKDQLDLRANMEEYMLGIPPSLNRFVPQNTNEVRPWEFMNDKLWYSYFPSQARRAISNDKHAATKHLVMRIMQSMNANSKARGRIIEFKQVAYGYRRVNPLYGAEYVLDLLLLYKRFRSKPISIPVRRHAYLQQTFSRTIMHEFKALDVPAIRSAVNSLKPGILSSIFGMFRKKSVNAMQAIGLAKRVNFDKSDTVQQMGTDSRKEGQKHERKILRFDSGKYSAFADDVSTTDVVTVNIVIPLKGRFETFRTFMEYLEKVCLIENDPVSLLIILFTSQESVFTEEDQMTIDLLDVYAKRYPQYELRLIPITGVFSRGLGLEIAASHFSSNSLLFFCDIDVVFDNTFTRKCRANTIRGSRVYYPILFSEFHPNFQRVWSLEDHLHDQSINLLKLQNTTDLRRLQQQQDHFDIGMSHGYWRNYGYGLLCAYKSDFLKSGGFDISIQGWGMEDVDLVDKFITGHSAAPKSELDHKEPAIKHKVGVLRALDPSLVHVYHPSYCDVNLAENQLRMCRASRASGMSSIDNLANAWSKLRHHENVTRNANIVDPVNEIQPLDPDQNGFENKVKLTDLKNNNYSKRRARKMEQNFNDRKRIR